jgi:hypothetical protein
MRSTLRAKEVRRMPKLSSPRGAPHYASPRRAPGSAPSPPTHPAWLTRFGPCGTGEDFKLLCGSARPRDSLQIFDIRQGSVAATTNINWRRLQKETTAAKRNWNIARATFRKSNLVSTCQFFQGRMIIAGGSGTNELKCFARAKDAEEGILPFAKFVVPTGCQALHASSAAGVIAAAATNGTVFAVKIPEQNPNYEVSL